LVETTGWYDRLQEAADAFKCGVEECNLASRALARAANEKQRTMAARRHHEAYRKLEQLKQEFMQATADAPADYL
jgi:hypothetical protein